MKGEIPFLDKVEQNALGFLKHSLRWKAGKRRSAKQKYNRRVRKQVKEFVWNEVYSEIVSGENDET